jgi:ATP-dependent helicase/nuclease subunit B
LIKNIQEIEALLLAGGTLLVPSRQRAVAIRLAYAHGRLAEGARSWAAPDVLTPKAWLQRCVDESRLQLLGGGRRLGAHEEWLAWRAAAREAAEGLGLLQPAALADALREATELQRDWQLPSAAQEGPEGQLHERARQAFTARCRALGAVSGDDWTLLLGHARPVLRPLWLAGFESLGTALRARLESLGACCLPVPGDAATRDAAIRDSGAGAAPGATAAPVDADRIIPARDLDDELQQAARWCRTKLLADPGARLLVVVPQLAQCKARAARTFDRELQGSGLLAGPPGEALQAIEGGQALADYPMVQAALAWLGAMAGESQFDMHSTWLRSPYLGLGGLAARLDLEVRLREHDVGRAALEAFMRLVRQLARGSVAEVLQAALAPALAALAAERGARREAGAWAPLLAAWLEQAGWPGSDALGSDEQQQRQRFEELLGEFAHLSAAAGRLRLGDAVALLTQLAQRTLFEPATGDVPVTLTASTGDPLVRYDGIWIAGLNAEQWPRPARPDPFVGVAAQRRAGILRANAEGQAMLARAAMAAWRARADDLVYSYSQVDGDAELQPSSLLGRNAPPDEIEVLPAAGPDGLRTALQAASRREPLPVSQATPLAPGESLPGGTRALGLQAQCPFHAFAELRLGARALPEPAQGLSARDRGVMLHAALQRTWESLGDSRQLADCRGAAREQLVATAVADAVQRFGNAALVPVPQALLAIEARRLHQLVLQMLAADELRAPFAIGGLEQMLNTELGGVPIEVRIDRHDALLDARGQPTGQVVVIDYKSGTPSAFDPLAARPAQAQLLAYAQCVPGELAGIAYVHLREGRLQWRGAVAESTTLPGLGRKAVAGEQWPAWRAHWAQVVPRLAQQLAHGVAWVDPLESACRQCHLAALCRVGSARHAAGCEAPLADEDIPGGGSDDA